MTRRNSFRAAALMAVCVLVLATSPGASRADLGPEAVNWARASHYVGCSLGIMGAITGVGMAVAIMSCLMLLAEP